MAKQERLQSQLRLRLPTRKTVIQTFHLITTATRGEGAVGRRGGGILVLSGTSNSQGCLETDQLRTPLAAWGSQIL